MNSTVGFGDGAGSAGATRSISMPFHNTVYSAPVQLPSAVSRADSDTATRNVSRIISERSAGRSHWYGTSPAAWNVPTIGPLKPISALTVGPGDDRLVQVHDVGLERAQRLRGPPRGRASGCDRRDRAVRLPLDGRPDAHDRRVGRRAVARARRCARRRRAGAARARARAPAPARRRDATSSRDRSSRPSSRARLSDSRSLGQFGLQEMPLLGRDPDELFELGGETLRDAGDVGAQAALARSIGIGGRTTPRCPRPASKYTATGSSVAPVRSASVAGPAGSVVRSPKNSTSTPSPVRSRSLNRQTMRLSRSACNTMRETSGPIGTTSRPMASR